MQFISYEGLHFFDVLTKILLNEENHNFTAEYPYRLQILLEFRLYSVISAVFELFFTFVKFLVYIVPILFIMALYGTAKHENASR